METYFRDPDDGAVYVFGGESAPKLRTLYRRVWLLRLMDADPSKRWTACELLAECAPSWPNVGLDTIRADLEWLARNGPALRCAWEQSKAA